MWKHPVIVAGLLLLLPSSQVSAQQDLLNTLQGAIGGITGSGNTDSTSNTITALSNDDIIAGLREALRVGTERVVGQLGTTDGFNADPDIHIPLPASLQKVQSALKTIGLSSMADDVELKLNRAAEEASPKTKELIWNAIADMSLDDAKQIYEGPDDAATQYFKRTSSDELANIIRPIVDQTLNTVGAVSAYDAMMEQYTALPFVPDVKADLADHTVTLTLQGLFHYLAAEEAAIRQNPAKRTTELLTRVFGS